MSALIESRPECLAHRWAMPCHFAVGFLLGLVVLTGCRQSGPIAPESGHGEMVITAPGARLSQGKEAIVALFDIALDGVAMQGTATPLPVRTTAQGELFDLDIAPFTNQNSLRISGLQRTADDHLKVEFHHAHPFPACSDPAGTPNGFSNRADLGYTGRLLLLVNSQVQSFFNGEVLLDPTLVVNSDGYLKAGHLLATPLPNANTFPYVLLADELEDNRIGVSNGGNPMGNYNLNGRGWDQSNIAGPSGNNGWTGFDFVHQGQTVRNTFTLSGPAVAANGNMYSLKAAIVIQYTDPRGPGDPPSPSTRKSNRLPRAGGTALDFAYRLPHAALDIAKISEPAPLQVVALTDRCDAQEVELRDWDRLATGTVADGATLGTESNVGKIALAGNFTESTMPRVEFSVPAGLFTNTEFTKVGGTQQQLGQEAIFTGERYGLPGSELKYQIIAGYAAGSTLVPGSYYGLVQVTDNEQRNDADGGYHFGLQPTSPPQPGPAALESTYQIVKIEVTVPPTPNFGEPSIYSSPCDDGGETFGTDTWEVGALNVPPSPLNYVWNFGAGASIISGGGSPNQIAPTVEYSGTPGIYEGSVRVNTPQGTATKEFTYQVDPPSGTYNPTTGGTLQVSVDGPRIWVAPGQTEAFSAGIPLYLASEPTRTVEVRFDWNNDGDFSDTGESWQAVRGTPPVLFPCPIAYDNLTNVPETRTVPYQYRDDGVADPGTAGSFDFRLHAGELGGGFATNFNMKSGGISSSVTGPAYNNNNIAVDGAGNIYVGGRSNGIMDLGIRQLQVPPLDAEGAFVMKLDPKGSPIWAKSFIATGADAEITVSEVQIDASGHVVVAGSFIGNVSFNGGTNTHNYMTNTTWAYRLRSESGIAMWSDAYVAGGAPSGTLAFYDATLMRPVEGNHLVLAGAFLGQANFGGGVRTATPVGGYDGFITRVNITTGAYITDLIINDNAVLSGPGEQFIHAIDVDASGNLHFAAGFNLEVNWCNGGSPCGGSPYTAPLSRDHMFLGQINVLGTPTLGRMYPVTGTIEAYSLVVDDAAGGINGGIPEVWITGAHDAAAVAGIGAGVAGRKTPFLIAVTPAFGDVFQRTFPGAISNTSASGFMTIAPSASADRIFVAGRFDFSTNFGSGVRNPVGTGDGFVIAYQRSSGASSWEQLLSSAGTDTRMGAIAVDSNGWPVAVGDTRGNTLVNQGLGRILPKSIGAGSTEAFIVLYKPDGTW